MSWQAGRNRLFGLDPLRISAEATNILARLSSGEVGICYSPVAQLVEQAAVNRRVVGSSPTGGADLFVTKLTVKPVNARRREIGDRGTVFTAFLAMVYVNSSACESMSLVRDSRNRVRNQP